MATVIPSVACLGVVGRNNNPLHLTILPSYNPSATSSSPPTSSSTTTAAAVSPLRTPLQFSLLLSSTLDVFELRARQHSASGGGALSGDLGLLCAVDERLACYGYETNTGVRFVAVVDMRGRLLDPNLPPSATTVMPAAHTKVKGNTAAAGDSDASGGGGSAETNPPHTPTPPPPNDRAVAMPALPPLSGAGILSSGGGTVTTAGAGGGSKKGSGTGTGMGSSAGALAALAAASTGLRDAEVKPLFRAMQTAWVRLLQNPFFELDEHVPPSGRGGRKITSRKFGEEMKRLGTGWAPGVGGFEGY